MQTVKKWTRTAYRKIAKINFSQLSFVSVLQNDAKRVERDTVHWKVMKEKGQDRVFSALKINFLPETLRFEFIDSFLQKKVSK